MLKHIVIFFSCCILISPISAQTYASFGKYWEPIHHSIIKQNYYEAYTLIQDALKYKVQQDTLHYLAGQSAFALNAFQKAEFHYRQITNSDFEDRHPEVRFLLAESVFRQGRYQESQNLFQTFIGQEVDTGDILNNAKFRLEQIKWARENLSKKNALIKTKRLEGPINTRENESAPIEMNQKIYYSGLRVDPKDKSKWQMPGSKILKFDELNNEMDSVEAGLLDNKSFIAHPAFNRDQTKFIFTICNYSENNTSLLCELWVKLKNNDDWSKAIRLSEEVNYPGYSSTQAKFSYDEIAELDRIYYSSNKPNGKGGYDVYTALMSHDGQVSKSENLDFLNTSKDEYTPFYVSTSKTLYFSSDGYPGFGGQDVFKFSWRGKDSLKVINMGSSVNTSYDELGFSQGSVSRSAYMTSNRPGSFYIDEVMQACCYDIYKLTITPATIEMFAYTKDAFDSLDLNGVSLKLYDITEGDSLVTKLNFPDRSDYNFKLIEDRKYKLVAEKSGFLPDSVLISTIDLHDHSPIKKNLYLREEKKLNVYTFEKTTNALLKGVVVQLWDLDNKILLQEVLNPDSNDFHFTLIKGTNYKLSATKNKYESTELLISSKETADEPILNRKLFLELSAIAELRKLLPIRLFFDNDMPNPRSESDTTNVLFSKIYNDYVSKKDIYIKEFTKGIRGVAKEKAVQEYNTFFEQDVKLNGDKLEIFMDKLLIILQEGHEIDIFLKGYASPRAKSDYNQKLSSRRVNSIRNEFDIYNQSSFHDFIVSKNLEIVEIPYGESKASTDVSDSLEDTRNSIYNLKAAYERRVEILEILKGVDDDSRL
ncbi:MAG: hypothetical protein IPM48_13445 [Saprospiraceae bacterium]|nr:hypothetical protein [Saprospiraceae bacterium]